jgi:3-oxoadipate enol-lactonase
VLLHSLGDSAAGWEPVARALADRWYVCAVDLRGHGASAPAERYSLELMREDVVGLVETLGLHPAVLVGHSLGGMVAYLAAAERPDLFSRLVLEETPLPVPSDPPRIVPERPERVAFDWAAVEAVYAQRNSPDPAWWDQLSEIEMPVLVVSGGRRATCARTSSARSRSGSPMPGWSRSTPVTSCTRRGRPSSSTRLPASSTAEPRHASGSY